MSKTPQKVIFLIALVFFFVYFITVEQCRHLDSMDEFRIDQEPMNYHISQLSFRNRYTNTTEEQKKLDIYVVLEALNTDNPKWPEMKKRVCKRLGFLYLLKY